MADSIFGSTVHMIIGIFGHEMDYSKDWDFCHQSELLRVSTSVVGIGCDIWL
jgi:hypothetical protein